MSTHGYCSEIKFRLKLLAQRVIAQESLTYGERRRKRRIGQIVLEIEHHLKIYAPVGRSRRIGRAGQSVGLAEQRRAKIPNRRAQVYVIKDVSSRNAERQTVSPARSVPFRPAHSAAAKTTPAPWTTRRATKSATCFRTGAIAGLCILLPLAKSKRLADAQIQRKHPAACQVIDRNDCLARLWKQIE